MPSQYSPPSVEAIYEVSEDEIRDSNMVAESELTTQRQEPISNAAMPLKRTSSDKLEVKSRKSRSATMSSVNRHSTKTKPKSNSSKRMNVQGSRDESSIVRSRHRRTQSARSIDSLNSSENEEVQDHRAVLAAARSHLTSPSLLSTLTSLTSGTNHSGGSSGSNSTITQASMSRHLSSRCPDPTAEVTVSPAVPDAPDVFSFLERDSPPEDEGDVDDDEDKTESPWYHNQDSGAPLLSTTSTGSRSSSASSSFHSDNSSDRAAGNDTDRSTSPERSVQGDDEIRSDTAAPADPSAAKIASQIFAAQQRQQRLNHHGSYQSFGTPQMPRGTAVLPHIPASQALSPRGFQYSSHSLPHAEKIPVAGYEALASQLSSHTLSQSRALKPIYRKFESLNHRLLLHLQDELAELEEQLHHLDNADTQSRSIIDHPNSDRRIIPASRRGAARAGGELEWRKIGLLNSVSIKLAQYNQALTSFNAAQALKTPEQTSIDQYRAYLDGEKPIVKAETRFLDMAGDLVVVDQERVSTSSAPLVQLQSFGVAVAAAILVPILTFTVIPGFVGRMTVVLLVAFGITGALIQAGFAGRDLLGRERAACAMIYGGVMVIIAGVVA